VFFYRPPLVWLVTANHVVQRIGEQKVVTFVHRLSDRQVLGVEIGKILADRGLSWLLDPKNDLAASPMAFGPDRFDMTPLHADVCLPLNELRPAMPCVTVGCPYGLPGIDPTRVTPLVLGGVIAGVDTGGHRIYTDAPTFFGNSGGPLVVFRSPFEDFISGGFMITSRRTTLLAGIITRMDTVTPLTTDDSLPNSGEKPPPLRLGGATPTDAIISLLDSEEALAIAAMVRPTTR
jgi:hypothetical protein